MKKKARGANFVTIRNFLLKNGPTSAIDIQKATKVKGNIYVMLKSMVDNKTIQKVGLLYQPTLKTAIKHDIEPSIKAPQPNPYANILKREAEHLASGIEQLTIARNYILLRIKELERATQQ